MASTTIAELELQITTSSTQAVKGLDDLIVALGKLKDTTKGGLGLTTIATQINSLGDAIKRLPKLDKFEQLRDILAQIKGIGDIDIAKGLDTTTQSTQEGTTNTQVDTSGMDEVTKSAEAFGNAIENDTNKYGTFQAKLKEPLERPLSDFEKELKRIDERIALFKQQWDLLAEKLNSVDDPLQANKLLLQLNSIEDTIAKLEKKKVKLIDEEEKRKLEETKQLTQENAEETKELSKELKGLEKPAKKAAGAFSKLVKSFGRIAFYRLVRAVIKEITNAFKEGINNLYQFSKEMDGSFAQSMDKISTAILSIRNGLGAALAPFIEALAPAIEKLGDTLMEFGNTIGKLGAIINGKTTYTKAVKSMKEYAEETKKAQTAAQGFDQLNIAAKDNVDYSTMFQEVNLEEETDSTLQNLGEILKEVKEIITELVSFLMPIIREIASLILPIIQDLLGNTIGFIKQILPALEQIIQKVVGLISILLQELQPALDNLTNSGTAQLLDDIFELVGIIVDILVPVLSTIFELIQPIADVIGAIMQVVADIIHSVIETIKPILEEISPILQPIIEAVVNVLKPVLEWIAMALQTIGGLVRMISDIFTNTFGPAIETVKSIFKGFFVLFTGDADLIKKTWSEIGEHLKNIWSKAWENIKKTFVGIINKIIVGFEKFINGLIDAINWITEKVSKVWDWTGIPSIPQISNVTFKQIGYAQGGYGIPKGQLFIANEMGAEMVGSMDGKTAVANNQQIIEGIKQGVYEAFMTAKGSENGNEINLNVYLSGKQLKAEYDRLTNASGVRIGTGGLAY